MRTVAIVSQKGGAGKTTLAINLAGAAEASGRRTVIIDLDPQASAKAWHDQRREECPRKRYPVVVSAQAARLHEELWIARKRKGADLCLIDTAPQSTAPGLAAAKAADLILIPCRASYFDLNAMEMSIDLVMLARRPAAFVLSCVRPGDKALPEQAEQGLAQHAIAVSPVRISLRAAFVHSLTAGQTVEEYDRAGAAAREIRALLKWQQDYKVSFHLNYREAV